MYKVYFIDGTEFQGGEPQDSKWNEIPDKPIQKLEYQLVKIPVILENFEAYNHIVEKVQFVNKAGNKITKLILMAKKRDKVYQLIYDFEKGKAFKAQTLWGKEYLNNPVTGWKKGVEGMASKISIS
jgi:hypothetical protein